MSEDASSRIEPDAVVDGRYQVRERLGAGGMGTVYRAERVKLGRAVAIKFLKPAFARQRDFVRRFEREALAMSRIYHPHCVSIIDYGMHEDSPYLVMEYVPGRSLARVLADGPLPPRRAVAIVRQVLDTLSYFHKRNVLHRDLKAENIMIAGDEEEADFVKLLDFGMAKLLAGVGADMSISAKGIVVGTPSAMSPEQIRELPLDARSDIYSTGVLLYHMLVGKRPFAGDDIVAVMRMHLQQEPVPPSRILGTRAISPELEAVVMKALVKDRDQRFADAAAMSAALAATREGKLEERSASIATVVRAGPGSQRSWLGLAGWAVAAALAGLLALVLLRSSGEGAPDVPGPAEPAAGPAVAAAPPDAGASPRAAAPVDAAAAPVDAAAPAPPPWAPGLADARARLERGDHVGALRTLAAAIRPHPEARADGEVIATAVATLAAPTGDRLINLLLHELGITPQLIDALAAAVTGAGDWYQRHHAWQALHRAGRGDRADRVGLWIADLELADSCKAMRSAHVALKGSRDPRAVALLAEIADPAQEQRARVRACLLSSGR